MAENAGLPVSGYRPQSDANVGVVNFNKQLEERCLRQIDSMQAGAPINGFDPRMIAIARTGLQEAFMWLNRAVFQPGRVALPGDETLPDRMVPRDLEQGGA